MLRSFLLVLGVIALFMSCQRTGLDWDDLPIKDSTAGCRLARVVQGIHNGADDDDTVYKFYYDALGKLEKIVDSGSGGTDYTYPIRYDGQGRVVSAHSGYGPIDSLHVIYDAQGNISELYAYDSKVVFEYAGSNLPKRAVHYNHPSSGGNGWELSATSEFVFQNGNLVSEEISEPGSSTKYKYTNSYHEDAVISFDRNLRLLDYGLFIFLLPKSYASLFSKNHLKEERGADPSLNEYWTYKIEKGQLKEVYGDGRRAPDGTFRPYVSRFFQYECK